MSSILVIILIIMGSVIAIGYTSYRIIKGLICGTKSAGRKVKVRIKNMKRA
jgi:hypothetical protein